jgi:hypothetical protein
MAGHVAQTRSKRNAYRILMGNPESKRPLGRLTWEDNIRMEFREIRWGDVD